MQNTISLRFFNIYGIGQSLEYGGVITKFAERLTNNKPIVIYGDGYQLRDFISIKDVVRAIIMASSGNYIKKSIIYNNNSNNIFNIATGKPKKIVDIANIMIKLFDKQDQIKNNPNNIDKIIYKDPSMEIF